MVQAAVIPIKRKKKSQSKRKTTKKATKRKAAKKKTAVKKAPRKRVSRAEKFMKSKDLQADFCKKYKVCTGKFRRTTGTPPTPSHSLQAQVKLPDGKLEWVYKQDVFQVGHKAKKKATKKKAAKKK